MTTKKTKTTTKIKTEKIDLEEVRKTKMFSCNLEIPGNMEKFFNSNKQHLVESIIPLAATMFSNEQACFFCFATINGKRYAIVISENAPDGTPLN